MKSISKLSFLVIVGLLFVLIISGCGDKKTTEPEPNPSYGPAMPSEPFPANHAADQPRTVNLAWTCAGQNEADTLTYSVYFGATNPPALAAADVENEEYDLETLEYSMTYYWKIVAYANHGDSTIGPVWDFATGALVNSPPNSPSNPNPADGAMGVSYEVNLTWSCTDPNAGDVLSYNVYFGLSEQPEQVGAMQSEAAYDPGTLAYATEYFWQVVAYDNSGDSTAGELWHFTTGESDNSPPNEPSDPSPTDETSWREVESELGWYCSDPDGDDLTYDIYLGTSADPSLLAGDQIAYYYDPGTLSYGTMYYWKVVAFDTHGDSTVSPVWSFETRDQNTDAEVSVWYGNFDGSPVEVAVNERIDMNVYMMGATSDIFVGSADLNLGANETYVDSMLSGEEGTINYPLSDWDISEFNEVLEGYNPEGWFCEPYVGIARFLSTDTPLFTNTTPQSILVLKIRFTDSNDVSGRLVDAFIDGINITGNYSNVGDSLGYDLNLATYFSQVKFQ